MLFASTTKIPSHGFVPRVVYASPDMNLCRDDTGVKTSVVAVGVGVGVSPSRAARDAPADRKEIVGLA